ncbi:MAG: hypothetical protein AB7R89_00400 [Dehalococcoidia bacterium]
MTLFDIVLGENGPAWLLGAVAIAAALTLIAAGLEIALERAGGPDPAATPDWFAEHGPALFILAGMPALLIALAASLILTVALGNNPERSGLPLVVPIFLDLAVIVAIIAIGLGSPMTQHWGLGIAAFGVGVSAIFPLLYLTNTLPFAPDGSLPYPDRFIFALAVGLILLTQVAAAAALISLIATSVRTWRALRARRDLPPARLTLIRPGE